MPLTLFMVLGTLQLFMLLQGRIFAEHAAYSAVRVGSVRHADCEAMTQASILALLPSFTTYLGDGTPGASPSEKLANAFAARTRNKPDNNRYDAALDDPHDGSIVWLYRESPTMRQVRDASEDDFDDPDSDGYTLEVRVVYWYPLRIPFANWVMATMYRAYFGLGDYTHQNPLMPAQRARWTQAGARSLDGFRSEFMRRFNAEQYVFPVVGTAAMRMMTPPRRANFRRQHCEPTP
ncbi:MAG: pilus assembly protein TadE [Archangium gephyra]|uniref:Pilus assembly protein TadE n=1 Tax=Archangium gephyra TaxID=48 RepID=A0A2W5T0X8_9BACT|nr:MAG: pilus assembly protein TadE [Archangium gephyra]